MIFVSKFNYVINHYIFNIMGGAVTNIYQIMYGDISNGRVPK